MTDNENTYTVGIIAEYNPFHNGHAYHIKKAKEMSHAAYVIVVLSGDYVQRGVPAILDKYTRTSMALNCGADLVLEMPSVFATGSAEDFASCGVALLDGLGVVDSLCFGSECGDTGKLWDTAAALAEEPPEFTARLKEELKLGATYPKARMTAFLSLGGTDDDASLLSSPNNILGIEYCKALMKRGSTIRPLSLLREGNGYHDGELGQGFSSATAIRKAMKEGDYGMLKSQVPFPVYCMLEQARPIYPEDFSGLLNAALLACQRDGIPFDEFMDASEDLSRRIDKSVLEFASFPDRIDRLKTRQYTYTRISRALLHILLGIRRKDAARFRAIGYAPYARVLGFRREAASLMSDIKQKGSLPLVTKTADAESLLGETAYQMLKQDMYGSHLYQSVCQDRYHNLPKNEFTRSVIIL